MRQSIPGAYLTIYVTGNFDIDVYIDVNGQWVSGNQGNKIEWKLSQGDPEGNGKPLKTWIVKRQVEQELTEFLDQAEWGQLDRKSVV